MENCNPIIIDVEASGFGKGSYPIEVGFALPDRTTRCFLIQPHDGWVHWNEEAENIHGIQRDTLLEKGQPIDEVVGQLNYFLANKTVYSDGWCNDLSWISLLFDVANLRMNFSIESLNVLLSEDQFQLWGKTRDRVQSDMGLKRHRASSDALIIQETFMRTMGHVERKVTGTV